MGIADIGLGNNIKQLATALGLSRTHTFPLPLYTPILRRGRMETMGAKVSEDEEG